MARVRTRPTPWAEKFDDDNYKDYRRGACDDAFWDEDEMVDHVKGSRRKKPEKKKGCPGNDYKAHVYVWVDEVRYRYKWSAYAGSIPDKDHPYTVSKKTCCGCNKVTNRKYDWETYYG